MSGEDRKFKFDVVIGNPPYQEEVEGTSDRQIYPYFMDEAYKVSNIAEFITKASFLFNAGKTSQKWNKKMLNDRHLKVLFYEPKASNVFANVGFKGGVAVTYWNRNENHNPIGTFSPFPLLKSIIGKVIFRKDFTPLSDEIYLQNKFNLDALYSDYPDIKNQIGSKGKERRLTTSIFSLPIFVDEKDEKNSVEIKGIINSNQRTSKFMSERYLDSDSTLYDYTVIVPKSSGSGALGETLSTPLIGEPLIGEPLIGYTQSFIGIGKFKDKDECIACFKYVKTKFCRVMLGTLKVTQDNNKGTWKNVPLQDFTESSDIDWSKSIPEIDQQLYKKYGLSSEEIGFIETHVKEMD